jgi:hypothetical protein
MSKMELMRLQIREEEGGTEQKICVSGCCLSFIYKNIGSDPAIVL